jgi:hypothetical protein
VAVITIGIVLLLGACRGERGTSEDGTGPAGSTASAEAIAQSALGSPADAVYPGEASVPRFGTAEIVLSAAALHDASRGPSNPFTDFELTAYVRSPSGKEYVVDGFFDGDGRGGLRGDRFKLRICPDEPGRWTWTTHSNDASMDGRQGAFLCAGRLLGVFAAGPLVVDPAHPRSFRHREGRATYLLGNFLDTTAPEPLQFSHTLFSESLTEDDRHALVARHLAQGLNKINVYIANRGDYGGLATTPWLGSAARADTARFDLSRWQTYELWVRRLRERGLATQFWFFADDSDFGSLPLVDRLALVRYATARLSAFSNTLFTLALEWQEGWSREDVAEIARGFHRRNPWDRLLSVHGVTGEFAFPDEPWADYMAIQSGFDGDHSVVYRAGLRNRALVEKPLVNEEFSLGEPTTGERRKTWAAFMAGGAGSGTGTGFEALGTFVSQVPFQELAPANDLVVSGSAYALAAPPRHYVLYLYDGGSVRLDLAEAPGPLRARWFDPWTGTFLAPWSVSGGGIVELEAPGDGDWALDIRRPTDSNREGAGLGPAPAEGMMEPTGDTSGDQAEGEPR